MIELRPADLPPGLVEAVARFPPTARLVAGDPSLARALSVRAGRSVPPATTEELRSARTIVWRGPPREDRPFALALARITLERALRSPEEVLISLAREEERLERALGREERAAAAFLPVAGTPLAEYRVAWDAMRETLRAHHAGLEERLEYGARNLAPNLSAVLGEKVAARLVAAAGGLPPLGRMSASRLQLLGTRRRPSPERGPRFGIIYRAVRMDEVPVARRGAYARSLAALGVIAARADAPRPVDPSRPSWWAVGIDESRRCVGGIDEAPRTFRPASDSPRLAILQRSDRTELWTETVGQAPPVYGERWTESDGRAYRSFEPTRSKLSAAIVKEWSGPVPATGESWLYLGAASGTTASHVADLVGPTGRVYALERSLRPFARLLALAERWPNLVPILGDAREPPAVRCPRSAGPRGVRGHRAGRSGRDRAVERGALPRGKSRVRSDGAQDREHGAGRDGGPACTAGRRGDGAVPRPRAERAARPVPPGPLFPRRHGAPRPTRTRGDYGASATARAVPRATTTVTISSSARTWSRPTV